MPSPCESLKEKSAQLRNAVKQLTHSVIDTSPASPLFDPEAILREHTAEFIICAKDIRDAILSLKNDGKTRYAHDIVNLMEEVEQLEQLLEQ